MPSSLHEITIAAITISVATIAIEKKLFMKNKIIQLRTQNYLVICHSTQRSSSHGLSTALSPLAPNDTAAWRSGGFQ
jgi:hypothetical protein